MIQKKIDELIEAIKNSTEYINYIEINNNVKNNNEINELIKEIKLLQKKATLEQLNNNNDYYKTDEKIKDLFERLNKYTIYQEYLSIKEELNNMITEAINIIQKYLNSKI